MVFKKDLTPIGRRGTIVKQRGKGAREQARGFGGAESLTGGDPINRMSNLYPKPEPVAAPAVPPPPVPMGAQTARLPTAMMPGGGEPDGDEAV